MRYLRNGLIGVGLLLLAGTLIVVLRGQLSYRDEKRMDLVWYSGLVLIVVGLVVWAAPWAYRRLIRPSAVRAVRVGLSGGRAVADEARAVVSDAKGVTTSDDGR